MADKNESSQSAVSNNTVSDFDISVYRKIRDNVTRFIRQAAEEHDSPSIRLLDIAPQDHAGAKEFFHQSQVYTADIDEDSGADHIIDICRNNSDTIEDNSFDIIVCTEVLEHTLNPFQAVDEIHRLLRPGGLVFITTPFNFRIHGPLPDCWRFTEHGLRALLHRFLILDIVALEDENRFLMPLHYATTAKKA